MEKAWCEEKGGTGKALSNCWIQSWPVIFGEIDKFTLRVWDYRVASPFKNSYISSGEVGILESNLFDVKEFL